MSDKAPAVQLRQAQASDMARLLRYIETFYAEEGSIRFAAAGVCGALEGLMADPSLGRVWLIEAGGAPAGYLVVVFGYSLEWHGRDAFVDEFFVEPPHRSAGVGTAALRLAEEACHEAGIRALHLEVDHGNTRAQALYRRFGYVDHHRYLMTKLLVAPRAEADA